MIVLFGSLADDAGNQINASSWDDACAKMTAYFTSQNMAGGQTKPRFILCRTTDSTALAVYYTL